MCMLERLILCAAMLIAVPTAASAQAPQFGRPIALADIAPWDISIGPDGKAFPLAEAQLRRAKPSMPRSARLATARRRQGAPMNRWSVE